MSDGQKQKRFVFGGIGVALAVLVIVIVFVLVIGQIRANDRQIRANARIAALEGAGFAKEADLSQYAKKSEVPSVAGLVNQDQARVIAEKVVSDTLRTKMDVVQAVQQTASVTPAQVATQSVSTTTMVASSWDMVDFHPSGDKLDVVNVDHKNLPHVTIAWYFAGPGEKAPAEACTIHVSTDPKGERITFLGAFRTWQWVGSGSPTKDDIHKLVREWIVVLEKEPRGACSTPGIYSVTWQDSSLVPSNPKGRP